MKRIYLPLLLIILALVVSSCDKMDSDDFLMTEFYQESLQLKNYTTSEVKEFGDRFVKTTTEEPQLQHHELYQPTVDNLEIAGYEVGFKATVNEWGNEITAEF